MGAYMYPINIKHEKEIIKFEKRVDIDDPTYIELQTIIDNVMPGDKFSIDEDNSQLVIYGSRLESDSEYKLRVARQELYMINYKAFHEKIAKDIADNGRKLIREIKASTDAYLNK